MNTTLTSKSTNIIRQKVNHRGLAFIFVFLMVLTGCVSTQVKGYTDSAFQNHQMKKVMVSANNVDLSTGEIIESSMVGELNNMGVSAESFSRAFPPTRQRTRDEVKKAMLAMGYDSIIFVELVGSEVSTRVSGYQTYGNVNYGTSSATVHGNRVDYSGGNVNHNSTTTAMTSKSRHSTTSVKIYDIKSEDMIWVGSTDTNASGHLFTGAKASADSMASNVVKTLKESGRI